MQFVPAACGSTRVPAREGHRQTQEGQPRACPGRGPERAWLSVTDEATGAERRACEGCAATQPECSSMSEKRNCHQIYDGCSPVIHRISACSSRPGRESHSSGPGLATPRANAQVGGPRGPGGAGGAGINGRSETAGRGGRRPPATGTTAAGRICGRNGPQACRHARRHTIPRVAAASLTTIRRMRHRNSPNGNWPRMAKYAPAAPAELAAAYLKTRRVISAGGRRPLKTLLSSFASYGQALPRRAS